eukprot:TRINITY_DN14419_c0_g1_i1.p1 TRINITY_DN14419_c0_g1~~TRINITY_DN14419_c0_g1_i1.p1  ORF type:complete len:615 (+),score=123.27 TRINITY_DN14419_c0_g1_i1:86-1846(+)
MGRRVRSTSRRAAGSRLAAAAPKGSPSGELKPAAAASPAARPRASPKAAPQAAAAAPPSARASPKASPQPPAAAPRLKGSPRAAVRKRAKSATPRPSASPKAAPRGSPAAAPRRSSPAPPPRTSPKAPPRTPPGKRSLAKRRRVPSAAGERQGPPAARPARSPKAAPQGPPPAEAGAHRKRPRSPSAARASPAAAPAPPPAPASGAAAAARPRRKLRARRKLQPPPAAAPQEKGAPPPAAESPRAAPQPVGAAPPAAAAAAPGAPARRLRRKRQRPPEQPEVPPPKRPRPEPSQGGEAPARKKRRREQPAAGRWPLRPDCMQPVQPGAPGSPELPEGLVVCNNFITPDEEKELLAAIDARPWDSEQMNRRVMQFGFHFVYGTRGRMISSLPDRPLPDFLGGLLKRIAAYKHTPQPTPGDGEASAPFLLPREPDQLIVNEYMPMQGIRAHVDRVELFDQYVSVVSLGCDTILEFAPVKPGDGEAVSVRVPGRSYYCLSGPARQNYTHGITPTRGHCYDGDRWKHTRRVSLTFRKVHPEVAAEATPWTGAASGGGGGYGPRPCNNWARDGSCRFGDRCRFSHKAGSRG